MCSVHIGHDHVQSNVAISFRHSQVSSERDNILVIGGDVWASTVEILVFESPTGYMLTSSGFLLLNWGIFYKFL